MTPLEEPGATVRVFPGTVATSLPCMLAARVMERVVGRVGIGTGILEGGELGRKVRKSISKL